MGDSTCGGIGISGMILATCACLYSGSSIIFWRSAFDTFALYVGVKTRELPQARQQYLPCLANTFWHVGQVFSGYFRTRFLAVMMVKMRVSTVTSIYARCDDTVFYHRSQQFPSRISHHLLYWLGRTRWLWPAEGG